MQWPSFIYTKYIEYIIEDVFPNISLFSSETVLKPELFWAFFFDTIEP